MFNIERASMIFNYLVLIIPIIFIIACREDNANVVIHPVVDSAVARECLINNNIKYNGVLKNSYEFPLSFQIGGKVASRSVESGSSIAPGMILMSLDDRDLKENIKASSAQYEDAMAKLNLATSNMDRYLKLFLAKVISQARYEEQQLAYESALAAFKQISASNEQNKNRLNYSRLKSEINGIITGVMVEEGQVVEAGQPVLMATEAGDLDVEVLISENDLHKLYLNQKAKVEFWALPGKVADGFIREITPVADSFSCALK